jgi:D-glycero-D-manno-heptose 1,7-bisphosphate phosphatase
VGRHNRNPRFALEIRSLPTGLPTAFLDRDGVLNVDRGFVHRPEELEFVPGAAEAVRLLNEAGYRVVVITNQSGIARGLYDEAALHRFHAHMCERLEAKAARIDAFYYCPHYPHGSIPQFSIVCECRKPKTGMLEQAAHDCPVDRSRSFLIGDKDDDTAAAAAFGIRGIKFNASRESLVQVVRAAMGR